MYWNSHLEDKLVTKLMVDEWNHLGGIGEGYINQCAYWVLSLVILDNAYQYFRMIYAEFIMN